MRAAAALAPAILLAAASAAASDLPPVIAKAMAERDAGCTVQGGRPEYLESSLRRLDLDGDGREYFILDDAGFRCSDGMPLHCGSGGCRVQVYLAGKRGARLVFSRLAQKATVKGRELEVSQGRGYPAITIRFEDGCAVFSEGRRAC